MAEITVDTMMPTLLAITAGSCASHNTGSGMNASTMQTAPCPVHHPSGKGYQFATIYDDGGGSYDVVTGKMISHLNANTMKFALRSLSKSWSRPAYSHGKIYSTLPTFNAVASNIVRYNEWNQLRNVLIQFGATTLPAISIGTRIDASFFQQLRSQYNHYKGLCLCNSDCGCNTVCVCNGDCGCNY